LRAFDEIDQTDVFQLEDLINKARIDWMLGNLEPDQRARAQAIPVRTAWTKLLNACTIRLPSGGPGIVFDKSMSLWNTMVARACWVVMDDKNYDDHWGRQGNQLLCLALLYVLRGDFKALELAYDRFGTIPSVNNLTDVNWRRIAMGMNNFILAHEYGHALLNHLSEADSGNKSNTRMLEHDADVFALKCLVSSRDAPPSYAVGMLMRCFATVEEIAPRAVSTHPRWKERWALLKADAYKATLPSPPSFIDDWFDGMEPKLIQWLVGCPPLH